MGRKQATPTGTDDYAPPLPAGSHMHLVRLLGPQGSNNFLSVDGEGVERLVEISGRLRRVKTLIVTRGDYAIVSLFPAAPDESARLVGEIVHILDKAGVKEWKKSGLWPTAFDEAPATSSNAPVDEQEDEREDEREDEEQEDTI